MHVSLEKARSLYKSNQLQISLESNRSLDNFCISKHLWISYFRYFNCNLIPRHPPPTPQRLVLRFYLGLLSFSASVCTGLCPAYRTVLFLSHFNALRWLHFRGNKELCHYLTSLFPQQNRFFPSWYLPVEPHPRLEDQRYAGQLLAVYLLCSASIIVPDTTFACSPFFTQLKVHKCCVYFQAAGLSFAAA